MRGSLRIVCMGWVASAALGLASCGGGGGSKLANTTPPAAAPNVAAILVDGGPSTLTSATANTLYTTVTICVPGSTTECQTIDHIQVDTGSYGLRLLSSVVTLTLPPAVAADGNSLVECTQFVSSYSWGPVSKVDLTIGGEKAAGIPIQLIGTTTFSNVPAACSSIGSPQNTVDQFGANGLLGIGVFAQDCGAGCTTAAPGYYYSCASTTCTPIGVPLISQVLNPIPLFAADNNGSFIVLPSVPAAGEATVSGSLIFGIDTASNNASGTQSVLEVGTDSSVDASGNSTAGDFTTVYAGQTLTTSFIDSGSNGLFFNDSSITQCPTQNNNPPFYCPASTLNLSATLSGTNNSSVSVAFSIENANGFVNTYSVLPDLGGTYGPSSDSFDWGLPFFYGRRVAVAIENAKTAVGTGPYVAF
jgi:hypothetical protein